MRRVPQAYLERTGPRQVQSVRAIFAMVRSSTGAGGGPYWNSNPCGVTIAQVKPDWHLMAFAYASLAIAAAGDTSIPFLYGQLIDAIALSHDLDQSRMVNQSVTNTS